LLIFIFGAFVFRGAANPVGKQNDQGPTEKDVHIQSRQGKNPSGTAKKVDEGKIEQ
jgi:hypothetical protein